MKNAYKPVAGFFGAMVVAFLFVPSSIAQCGGYQRPLATHASWYPQAGHAQLVRTNFGEHEEDDVSIVGFWHVKFVSNGVTSGIPGGIPKGTEVDAGYSQWHSDGTEIMNSGGRAPNTGDFCLGVWTRIEPRKYLLNHFAAAWDPTKGPVGPAGPAGELTGPGNIREAVVLAPNGESFSGTFTIDSYNEAGTLLSHLEGTITGTRIKVTTAPSSIF